MPPWHRLPANAAPPPPPQVEQVVYCKMSPLQLKLYQVGLCVDVHAHTRVHTRVCVCVHAHARAHTHTVAGVPHGGNGGLVGPC